MMKLASRTIEINGDLDFLNIGTVKFLKTLHTVFIVLKQIFQIKISNEINFLVIIIYRLVQFKVLFLFSPKFRRSTDTH